MRDSILVAQIKKVKAKKAKLFGLTGAGTLNPTDNKRFAASLLAALLLLAVIGVWALHGSSSASPAAIGSGAADLNSQSVSQNPASDSQQTSVSAETSSSSAGGSSSNSSSVNVSVNGQNIEVPQNGSVHKVIKNGNSTTTVDVNHSGIASNSNNSSTDVQVDSDSTSTTSQGGN